MSHNNRKKKLNKIHYTIILSMSFHMLNIKLSYLILTV